jgi:hypothetical protein
MAQPVRREDKMDLDMLKLTDVTVNVRELLFAICCLLLVVSYLLFGVAR